MAVRAPHVTLGDLEPHRVDVAAPDEPRNLGDLCRSIAVIEVKDERI
jgi:hypothetical protein